MDSAGVGRAAVGVNLSLAVAVAGGAIPGHGQPTVLAAGSAATVDATVPAVDGAGEGGLPEAAATVAMAAAAPPPHAPTDQPASDAPTPTPPAESQAAPAAAPVAAAPAAPPPAPVAPTEPAVAAPAPTPAPPAAHVANAPVPRTQPSPAQVQQALDGLERYVDSVFTPSAAQIAEAGDKVCTAFDDGQTFAQVKATARELVARVPLTTVHAGADDYVVRTMVEFYCPGHAPKLV